MDSRLALNPLHDLLLLRFWHIRWCLIFPMKATIFSKPANNRMSAPDTILSCDCPNTGFSPLHFPDYLQLKGHTVILLATLNVLSSNSFFHSVTFCATLFQH